MDPDIAPQSSQHPSSKIDLFYSVAVGALGLLVLVHFLLFLHSIYLLWIENSYMYSILRVQEGSLIVHGTIIAATLIALWFWLSVARFCIDLGRRERWVLPVLWLMVLTHVLVVLQVLFRYFDWLPVAAIAYALGLFAILGFVGYISVTRSDTFSGSLRKLRFQLPLVVVLVPAFGVVVLNLVYTDISQIDDADLALEEVTPVPAEENAYLALPLPDRLPEHEAALVDRFLDTVEEYNELHEEPQIEWQNVPPEVQQSLISESRFLADRYVVALSKPKFQCPKSLEPPTPGGLLCDNSGQIYMSHLTAFHAIAAANAGDYERSLMYASAVLRHGDSYLKDYYGPDSRHLWASRIFEYGLHSFAYLADALETDGQPRDSLKADALSVLRDNEYRHETLARTTRHKYHAIKELLLNPERYEDGDGELIPKAPANYFWHPNRTVQVYVDFSRAKIRYETDVCGGAVESALKLPEFERFTSYTPKMHVPNAIGKILLAVFLSSEADLKEDACETKAQYQNLVERYEKL